MLFYNKILKVSEISGIVFSQKSYKTYNISIYVYSNLKYCHFLIGHTAARV